MNVIMVRPAFRINISTLVLINQDASNQQNGTKIEEVLKLIGTCVSTQKFKLYLLILCFSKFTSLVTLINI